MNADFSFRCRLMLAEESSIGVEAPSLTLFAAAGEPDVVLASTDAKTPLKTAKEIVLRSTGWPTLPENSRSISSAFR